MFTKNSKIFLAGHKGMVGSAIMRKLKNLNYTKVITRSKKKLDLLDQKKTYSFLKKIKPDYVIIAAARVGGIKANSNYKSKFIYENLTIQNNLIHGSYLNKVIAHNKRVFLYPKYFKIKNYLFTKYTN